MPQDPAREIPTWVVACAPTTEIGKRLLNCTVKAHSKSEARGLLKQSLRSKHLRNFRLPAGVVLRRLPQGN